MALKQSSTHTPHLDAVTALEAQIRESASVIEYNRCLPEPLLSSLREAGLLRMTVPSALGGDELDIITIMQIIEALSRADGATGWLVMVQSQQAHLSAYLPEQAAQDIWGNNPDALVAGSHTPRGRAVPVDGGYVVSGRFPYGSGITHCSWLATGCKIYDGEEVRLGEDGEPVHLLVFTPVEAAKVIDTWTTIGLRGTGSHDYELPEVFVPATHTLDFGLAKQGRYPSPLYSAIALVYLSHGSQALGVARGALDAFVELASAKPAQGQNRQRDRVLVQAQFAEAEATVESARAFLYRATEEVWNCLASGDELPPRLKAHARLAVVHAVRSAVRAVEQVYYLGGGSSIYASGELDRRMRDVHAASAHFMASIGIYEMVGRTLLGVDDGRFLF